LKKDKLFKLADFGMGKIITDIENQNTVTKVGSPVYAAPEIFFCQDYSYKCDIFSVKGNNSYLIS